MGEDDHVACEGSASTLRGISFDPSVLADPSWTTACVAFTKGAATLAEIQSKFPDRNNRDKDKGEGEDRDKDGGKGGGNKR